MSITLPWTRRAAVALMIIGPPIGVLALISTFAVNVPFQDDWDSFSVVTNARLGTLSFADFWAQHSEHRIPAVKALIWLVGGASDYDVITEMLLGFSCVVVTLALLHRVLARSLEHHAPAHVWPMTAGASLLLFSLGFQEDWFWGLASLQLFLLDLMTVAVVWSITVLRRSPASLLLAVVAAVVGSLTHASGLLLWGTGALGLALTGDDGRRKREGLMVWAAAAVTMSTAYVWRLVLTSPATPITSARVSKMVVFAGTSLGTPFAYGTTPGLSLLFGVSGLVMLAVGLKTIHTERPALLGRLMPVLLLGAHGIATVALVAYGRADSDVRYAMVSHLIFGPTFFWIATLVTLAVTLALVRRPTTAWSRLVRRSLITALTMLLVLCYVGVNVTGYGQARAHSRNLSMALAALHSDAPIPASVSTFLYSPDNARLTTQIAALKASKLGPFSDRSVTTSGLETAFAAGPSSGNEDGALEGATCRQLFGWAWDPQRPDVPVAVELWRGTERLTTMPANWFRPDLLRAGIGNGQHGFFYTFDTPLNLGTGELVIARFAGSPRPLRNSPKTIFCR